MRITMICNVMDHPDLLRAGAVVDRADGVAEDWIARGLAVATPVGPRAVQADLPPVLSAEAEAFAAVADAAESVTSEAFAPPEPVVVPSPKRHRKA